MAVNGVWQLQKIVVRWCDWGGSSRGVREFMNSILPSFKEANPQIEVETVMKRGHPLLKGYYKSDHVEEVEIKNMEPEMILKKAIDLRNSIGKRPTKRRPRQHSQTLSVQGTWNTSLKL